MSDDNKISDEDRELFKKTVGDISKRSSEKHVTITHTNKVSHRAHYDMPDHDYVPSGVQVGSTDILEYKNTGLQHKVFARVKAGKFPIEGTLDLHGMKYDQAVSALNHFLNNAISNGKRFIMIIHGKGLSDPEQKAVLKNLTNDFLRQSPHVLAFHSAKREDGGTGAVYVLLRQ